MAGPAASGPQSDYGRKINDGPAAVLDHLRDGEFAGEHHAFEIDVDHCVPEFFVDIGDRAGAANTNVINQYVQFPICVNGGLRHFLAGIDVGDITHEDLRVSTLFFDLGQSNLGVLLIPVDQQDLGPLAGEQQGNGLPNADEFAASGSAGAGDDGDLAFKSIACCGHGASSFLLYDGGVYIIQQLRPPVHTWSVSTPTPFLRSLTYLVNLGTNS